MLVPFNMESYRPVHSETRAENATGNTRPHIDLCLFAACETRAAALTGNRLLHLVQDPAHEHHLPGRVRRNGL